MRVTRVRVADLEETRTHTMLKPMWEPGQTIVHLGWYVNLQRPYRRTSLGIEAMDLMLDINEIVRREIFDAETAERTRQEAAKMISRIENREPPFSEPWADWRPSASWRLPVLSDGWHEPF